MTTDALRRLQVEADRLPWLQAVAALRAPAASTVLAAGDRHLAASRLERLRRVLNEGYVVKPDGQAVIGSRVTVRHTDGEQELYELVAPGKAAVRQGRISTDAPLGASMGSCAVRRSRTRKRAAVGGGVGLRQATGRGCLTTEAEAPSSTAHGVHRTFTLVPPLISADVRALHEERRPTGPAEQPFPASDPPSWTGVSIESVQRGTRMLQDLQARTVTALPGVDWVLAESLIDHLNRDLAGLTDLKRRIELGRAMDHLPPALVPHPWVQGILLSRRQLEATLRAWGPERIGSAGERFEPTLHEAVAYLPQADLQEPIIASVERPGYRLGQRLIRAARVSVAGPPHASSNEEPPSASQRAQPDAH